MSATLELLERIATSRWFHLGAFIVTVAHVAVPAARWFFSMFTVERERVNAETKVERDRKIAIDLKIPPPPPEVRIDHERLAEAFAGLSDVARKTGTSMEEMGRVVEGIFATGGLVDAPKPEAVVPFPGGTTVGTFGTSTDNGARTFYFGDFSQLSVPRWSPGTVNFKCGSTTKPITVPKWSRYHEEPISFPLSSVKR